MIGGQLDFPTIPKSQLAIAECDDGQRDKIESVRSEVPTLRNVFVIEGRRPENAIKRGLAKSVTDAEFWS